MTARIVHVITGLGVGGAETMLAKLLEAEVTSRRARTAEVICLGADGPMADRIRATGIPLTCIGMGRGSSVGTVAGLRALARRLRVLQPDVVQCWMYHADLLGGLTARLAVPHAERIWSIRASSMPYPASLLTRAVIRACAVLSHIVPARIISCSTAAAALHVRMGYDARRIVVIPNGFDLKRFSPAPDARAALQQELGLSAGAAIVGCVARFDPQKDFATLFRAFERIAARHEGAVLVVAGHGCSTDDAAIIAMIPDCCRDRVHLLGVRRDIPQLTAAFDVAILTSAYGEGFPNVLGEALACGVPCVATDVGDSREIAGKEGIIAPVGDADGLATGVLAIMARPATERALLATRMRARALHDYELSAIAHRYWRAQDELLHRRAPHATSRA